MSDFVDLSPFVKGLKFETGTIEPKPDMGLKDWSVTITLHEESSMKLAIVGSREFPKLEIVKAYVHVLWMRRRDVEIVSGGARGVDNCATDTARRLGIPTKVFPVDRTGLPPFPAGRAEFARRANARNEKIVDYSDVIVAFWDGESRGTMNTINIAKKKGKPWTIVHADGRVDLSEKMPFLG